MLPDHEASHQLSLTVVAHRGIRKPRVAVMLAGHRANAVVWQQDRTWVTSTAYSDATIPFVARFLEANPIERDHGAVWARTLPNEAYLFESNTPTSRPTRGMDGVVPTFPPRPGRCARPAVPAAVDGESVFERPPRPAGGRGDRRATAWPASGDGLSRGRLLGPRLDRTPFRSAQPRGTGRSDPVGSHLGHFARPSR